MRVLMFCKHLLGSRSLNGAVNSHKHATALASSRTTTLPHLGHNQAAAYFTLPPPSNKPCTAHIPVQRVLSPHHVSCPCIVNVSPPAVPVRLLSSSSSPDPQNPQKGVQEQKEEKSVGIFQRFKNAYKEYGKVLVGVHCATSAVWFSMFYYAAAKGIDVVPMLEKMGAGEKVIKPFQSGAGNIAVMYLLYKIATPARYTVTIVGTQYTVKLLRRYGYMEPVSEQDSLRNLMKEGKQQAKVKVDARKEKLKDKADEMKEKYESKREDMKEKLAEKKGKFKDVREKLEIESERLKDKAEDFSDRFEKEKLRDAFDDTKSKIRTGAQEMQRKIDRDENIRDVKDKLRNTAERVKDGAYDMKKKMDKDETLRDVKENLDKTKHKIKDAASEMREKIQKRK